jgi:WD40 repeat protein
MNRFERYPGDSPPTHPPAEQLSAFLLGKLGGDHSAEVERHLTTCEVCAALLQTAPDDSLIGLFRQGQSLAAGEGPVPLMSGASYDFLAPAEQPDELGRLGPYRVLEVLGSGGMGVVFLADDPQLERRVALKVMKPVLTANPSARERFLREARSMARLSHARVVTIHHVGQERGVPFLAMELLDGESLDARLRREGQLPVPEALRIGREIAEGLAAAHQRGLVHRDIKPSNLWLEGTSGRVKILDFGLARGRAEQMPLTLTGALIGTPAYMAPERARGESIDPRSDLFSLGCVLYQAVTGEPPFRGADALTVLAAVVTAPPRPVREGNPAVPPAFADLIRRLLAKSPQERYPDAHSVVEALQAIESRSTRRSAAWRRRGLLLSVLVLGIVGALVYANRTPVGSAAGQPPADRVGRDQPAEAARSPLAPVLPELAPVEAVLGDGRLCHWALVRAVTVSRDGHWIASASADHTAIVWGADTGQPRYALCDHTGEVLCVAFDGDAKRLATGGTDNTLKLWDAEQGQLLRSVPMGDWVQTVAFSPDGQFLGGMTRAALRVWEAASGKEVFAAESVRDPLDGVGQGFAFSPDGRTLAHRGGDSRVRLIDVATWRQRGEIAIDGQTVGCLAFAPGGQTLAVGSRGGADALTLWDVATGARLRAPQHEERPENLTALAFSPDGGVLAAAFDWGEGGVRQWELASGRERPRIRLRADPPGTLSVAYSPDGGTLVTAGRDGAVRRWDAVSGAPRPTPAGPLGSIRALAIAPDGQTLAVGCDTVIHLLDLARAAERRRLHGHRGLVLDLAFSRDGTALASTALDGVARLWDPRTGAQRQSWVHYVRALAFRTDGQVLAGSRWGERALKLWDVRTGAEWRSLEQVGLDFSSCLALSPDGMTLAAGLSDRPPLLWDLSDGRPKRRLDALPGNGSAGALAFSPDGATVAVAHQGADPLTGLWDAATGGPRLVLEPCPSEVASLAFSPDGALLATAGRTDGAVRLWEAATGRLLHIYSVGPLGGNLLKIDYAADGRRLAVLNGNGTVSILRMGP